MGGRDGWVKEWGFDNPNSSNKASSGNISRKNNSHSKLGGFRFTDSNDKISKGSSQEIGPNWREIARESGMIGVIESLKSSNKSAKRGIKEILRAFLLSKKLRRGSENFGIKSGTFGVSSNSVFTNFGSKSSQHTSSRANKHDF